MTVTVIVGAWVVIQGEVCQVVQLDLEAATCIVDRIDGFIFQLIPLALIERLFTLEELERAVLERRGHRYRYFVSGL
ncbi:hypothetical protein [Bacillus thuringiensis]|uniref:hypothetical protein n=1 Tax=Bacillus thuringiensis TaxID=1428 RepID=UPI003B983468